jgi:hypothetical protein
LLQAPTVRRHLGFRPTLSRTRQTGNRIGSMGYPKEFSPILFILLVAVCAYLLVTGKLSGTSFALSIFFSVVAVAVIHNLDVMQCLTVKSGNVEATADFERIKKDVYAKATEVQHLAEQVAGMIAESVGTSNRFGGSGDPDPVAQEVRYRDRLRQTLIDMGVTKERRDELLAPFAHWVPFDLKAEIVMVADMAEQQKGAKPQERNELQQELKTALDSQPPLLGLDRVEKLLRQRGLASPSLDIVITRYRTFLTEDRVPPFPPGSNVLGR